MKKIYLIFLLIFFTFQANSAVILFDKVQIASTVPFDNSTNGFTSVEVQSAIEEAKNTAEGKVRFVYVLVNNSTLSNGQSVSWSSLTPNTPIVLPVAVTLKEIAYSNDNASSDATFYFYRRPTCGSSTGQTLFLTWTFYDKLSDYSTGLSQAFLIGECIYITFADIGDNPSDSAITLNFKIDEVP